MDKIPRDVPSVLGFVRLSWGFWSGAASRRAWVLTWAIVSLLLANMAVNVGLNRWHRWFFDMLETRDTELLWPIVIALALLIASGAGFAVAMVYGRMTLQLECRKWMTLLLLERWEAKGASRSIQIPLHGSPEFRIVEDIRLAIDPAVDMTIGLLNASILGTTFIGVLIIVGGSQNIDLLFAQITIPGYFAVAAIGYSAVVSASMYSIGRPLIRAVANKNEAEGRFLFELTNAAEGLPERTNPVSACDRFGAAERSFAHVAYRWRHIIRANCRLTWLSNSNTFFGPIFPLLIAMPKYLNGELSLGAVMQIVTAFTVVLGALNWFTDNYVRFAEWAASARRIDELYRAL